MFVMDVVRFMLSGLVVMVVMNILEEIVEVWNTVVMTYAFIFFFVSLAGSESYAM